MCVAYELDGKKLDYLPAAVEDQIKIKPIYETFPGWKVSTSGAKNMDSLPENAKKYIYFCSRRFYWCKSVKCLN